MSNRYPDALVYIAYARADGARVEPVAALLRAEGFTIHFEGAAAAGSGDYVQRSQQTLRQASALVVFVSAASAQSPWVEAETRAFQSQMARDGRRTVIPVRLDDAPLPLALAAYPALDGTSPAPAIVADALGDALRRALPAPTSQEPALGDAPADSMSAEPPDLSQYADTPIYTTATVSQRIGIRPLAVWTFEQHLGITHADAGAQSDPSLPRYSERDLIALSWLRDRVIAGEPTHEAAARLLAAQGPQTPASPATMNLGAAPPVPAEPVNEPADALVYIAYARADRLRVESVVAALRALGLSVHFDAANAHGSGDYVHQSQQALRRAGALVVFVSQASAQSPWIEAETRAFQAEMARDAQRTLIPVLLDDTPLPLSLAHYLALNGTSAAPSTLAAAIAQILDGGSIQTTIESDVTLRGASAADDIWGERYTTGAHDVIRPSSDAAIGLPSIEAAAAATSDMALPDIEAEPGAASVPAPAPPPMQEAPAPPPLAPPPAPAAEEPGYAPPPPTPQPITQPDRSRRTSGAPAPRPAPKSATQPTSLEQVTFTAYHPRELQPQQWQPLVVYLSLDDAATMALVAASAAERLAGRLDQFRAGRAEKAAGLARGAALRIIPSMPGFAFNPSYLDVTWQEDVQQHEFRMSAVSAQPGQAVNGVVQFYQGILLRAEVPISVFVGQAAARLDMPDAYAQAIARAYRRIFASYSHQDMPVVESCETAARTMGDQYLRDVSLLQSGQQWDPRLIQAINDADIFQLFWSKRAAASPYVTREWQHALMLLPTRPNFIRPVYWTRQIYPTPPELNALHFQPLSLSSLGWGRLRAAWYELRNR